MPRSRRQYRVRHQPARVCRMFAVSKHSDNTRKGTSKARDWLLPVACWQMNEERFPFSSYHGPHRLTLYRNSHSQETGGFPEPEVDEVWFSWQTLLDAALIGLLLVLGSGGSGGATPISTLRQSISLARYLGSYTSVGRSEPSALNIPSIGNLCIRLQK